MKITDGFLERGKSANGGWTKKQLALLGVEWPPQKGWKIRLEGKEISDEIAKRFIAMGGAGPLFSETDG